MERTRATIILGTAVLDVARRQQSIEYYFFAYALCVAVPGDSKANQMITYCRIVRQKHRTTTYDYYKKQKR